MSNKLFLKILKDTREIPSITTIIPMLLGEPLCDPRIFKRLELINKILPNKEIVLFTNCSLLTPKIIKELSKIKNLEMWFSLNGFDRESRQKLMGLDDYDHCAEMIDLFKKTGKPFTVSFVEHPSISSGEIKEFKKDAKLRGWNATSTYYKNWSGDKFKGKQQTRCKRAMSEMTIMYGGQVNLCCMEYGKVIFGDVNKKSVKEIWESPHRQMYCEAHSRGKFLLGPCSNCTKA